MRTRQSLIRCRHLRHNRYAFTLLEMILAMGIAVVLMLAIYQASVLHYAQLESGRSIVEQAQLRRSLHAIITADIRQVGVDFAPPTDPTAEAAESGASGSTTTTTTSSGSTTGSGSRTNTSSSSTVGSTSTSSSSGSTSTSSSNESSIPPGGVLGFSDSLFLVVKTNPADLDYGQDSSATSGPSIGPEVLVRYYVGSLDDNGVTMTGLIREVTPRIPDDALSQNLTGIATSELVAAEVQSVSFRYLDVTGWIESWDNTQTAPPDAIEVTLTVPAGPFDSQTTVDANGLSVATLRFITALPLPIADAGASSSTDQTEQGTGSTSSASSSSGTGSSGTPASGGATTGGSR